MLRDYQNSKLLVSGKIDRLGETIRNQSAAGPIGYKTFHGVLDTYGRMATRRNKWIIPENMSNRNIYGEPRPSNGFMAHM